MTTTHGEPRPFRVLGEPGPGKGPVIFRAMTACDCGCGLKARFEFCVGRDMILIDDPEAVRVLIAEMDAGATLLWGPEETTMTAAQRLLKEKHGTPDEFERAVRTACDHLFCTPEECDVAIKKYNEEWDDAGQG